MKKTFGRFVVLLVVSFISVVMTGCDGGNMGAPSSSNKAGEVETISIPQAPVPSPIERDWTFTGPTSPISCIGPEIVPKWTLKVNRTKRLLHIVKAAYHEDGAGCEATERNPTNFPSMGSMDYKIGESGETDFDYRGKVACGHDQVDVSIFYADGSKELILGMVVDSGKDCESKPTPPVPPVPPPPPPPQPPVCAGPFHYEGQNPFSLPNAGDATQLNYVKQRISPLLMGPRKTQLNEQSWVSDGNYPAVIVKYGTSYWLYTNVVSGQILNPDGKKDLSHVSRFVCK